LIKINQLLSVIFKEGKVKRRQKMKKGSWILAMVLICILLSSGCTSNPNYYVESYDELKNELKDYSDILFPDISRYEQENFIYVIEHAPAHKNDKHGYCFSSDSLADNAEISSNKTVLSVLNVGCTTLEYRAFLTDKTKGSWSVLSEFEPNIEIDGIAAEYIHFDSYLSQNETEDVNAAEGDEFPDGTFESWDRYIIEYRGCRYRVSGIVRLLPEEQVNTDLELIIEEGKEELLDIVRSIITQGEEE